MIGGSYVTKDGEDIVSCGKKTDNVSVFSNGADVNISSYESNFTASNLKITPGYYKNDGDNLTPVFQAMGDGSSVYLFKIL